MTSRHPDPARATCIGAYDAKLRDSFNWLIEAGQRGLRGMYERDFTGTVALSCRVFQAILAPCRHSLSGSAEHRLMFARKLLGSSRPG